MFCDQCEQTAQGIACTSSGVCGKDAKVALRQDQLIYIATPCVFDKFRLEQTI